MSALQTHPPARAAVAAPPPARHRFWIPVSVLVLLAASLATPVVLLEFEKFPEDLQHIAMMAALFGVLGAATIIVLWWFFLSGFSWRTRIAVVVLLGMIGSGFYYVIRKPIEFTLFKHLYLVPKFTFIWQKTPDEIRTAHKATEDKTELPPIDLTIKPTDYPRFCGRDGDSVAHGPALALDWSSAKPKILYKRPCVHGYSSFAVAGNAAITIEQIDDKQTVVCYDRNTGHERWTCDQLGSFKNIMGDGPRATPTIDDKGMVFALGATGILVCLDGATGKEQWQINILEDNASKNVLWGMSGSPLIVDDVVVVNPGVDPAKPAGRAICAYDRKTGKRIWAAGDHKAGYSSPRLATLCGVRQILLFDGEGLAGLDPTNGNELWRYGWTTAYDMNNIQPVVCGDDRIFISSELSNGCAMVRVKKGMDGWSVKEEWKHKRFWAKFSNPVFVSPALYGLSGGDLISLDVENGKLFWKERGRGRFGQGQVLAAGDRLLVQSDDGTIFLVAAETTAYKELGQLKVLDGKTWNTPALAGTQLFLRDNEKEMACVELPTR